MMKKLLLSAFAAAALLASAGAAQAQSGCQYIVYGATLTVAQWNSCFTAKNNTLGYTPVNKAGDSMTGPLILPAPATYAGLSLGVGSDPSVGRSGDVWLNSSGMNFRIGSQKYGPTNTPFYTGPSAPSGPNTFSLWNDTSGATVPLSIYDGSQWVNIGTLDPAIHSWALPSIYSLNMVQVVTPTQPTAAAGASGVLTGSYTYAVTYVTADGETDRGNPSNTVVVSGKQINLTGIPVSTSGSVIARKIYRTVSAPVDTVDLQLVATINDNTTTVYTDNTPDGSLGTGVPYINSTGNYVTLNGDSYSGNGTLSLVIGAQAMPSGKCYASLALGGNALQSATAGCTRMVAVGPDSFQNALDAIEGAALGVHSCGGVVHGKDDTCLGYAAGLNNEGDYNFFSGAYSYASGTAVSHGIGVGSFSCQLETATSRFCLDSYFHATEADARANSLLYGELTGSASTAWLHVGGELRLPGTITTDSGNPLYAQTDTVTVLNSGGTSAQLGLQYGVSSAAIKFSGTTLRFYNNAVTNPLEVMDLESAGQLTLPRYTTAGLLSNDVNGLVTSVATLSVSNGGTGISSYAVGDLIYASGATALSKLADVAAGSFLASGGVTTAPTWNTSAQVATTLGGTAANVQSLNAGKPYFKAVVTSVQSNVTGNGTAYTVQYTEAWDTGNNFASNTFTAPVTGKYRFTVSDDFVGLASPHTSSNIWIACSTAGVNYLTQENPFNGAYLGEYTAHGTTDIALVSGETCTSRVVVANGALAVGINNNVLSFWVGELVQ